MSDKTIKKYMLSESISEKSGYCSFTKVDLPKGAKVIDVSCSDGTTYLHVIADHRNKKKERWFATFKEDMPMEDYEKKTFEYIGRVSVITNLYTWGWPNQEYVFEMHD